MAVSRSAAASFAASATAVTTTTALAEEESTTRRMRLSRATLSIRRSSLPHPRMATMNHMTCPPFPTIRSHNYPTRYCAGGARALHGRKWSGDRLVGGQRRGRRSSLQARPLPSGQAEWEDAQSNTDRYWLRCRRSGIKGGYTRNRLFLESSGGYASELCA